MEMISNARKIFTRNLLNIPGWRTNRKIVVIESDDWGSIRMPSREIYEQFLAEGIRVDKDRYCKYDSLATPDDLEALFEVLTSVKDQNGRHAVITANTLVANPDFERIKEADFAQYYYEPFTETLTRNQKTEGSFVLWKQGMDSAIFHPQFHGREHLNVKKWMHCLKSGKEIMRLAFSYGTLGLNSKVDSRINTKYTGALNSGLKEDIEAYNYILEDGLDLFEDIFGYRSLSFIPPTYTWHPDIEPSLFKNGVRYLQGMVFQRVPLDDDTTFRYKKNNFLGYKSKAGLTYLTRNAYFEPTQFTIDDCVSDCLNRVKIAFRWHKPAIISMHRLNIIGAIDERNRTRNLILLKKLLLEITHQYPDVEFMSSDELGKLIQP